MYSILLSKINALELIKTKKEYGRILNENSKVAILPWSFPQELDAEKLENEFFKKDGERYNKYVKPLKSFGVKESNITICNCYSQDHHELAGIIDNSDVIVLTGGNPEMLMSKILHKTELFYKIKHYKGIIIGESAGCLLQLERYFITAENNFYEYMAFYDGIGVIDDDFLLDVHTQDTEEYLGELNDIAEKSKKKIYAIANDGAILYNRENKDIDLFGNVKQIG